MLADGLDKPGSPQPITLSKLLVVEGRDQFYFFKALLQDLNLLARVEIRNFGNVENLRPYLFTLPSISGFRGVVSLGIVRDAERNGDSRAEDAFRSVCDALHNAGLSVPRRSMIKTDAAPAVCVFILPDCVNPGMIETLCLESVKKTFPVCCIDDYFCCVQQKGLSPPKNNDKARLHAYLSAMREPVGLLGQAAHAGCFPWTSPVFGPIKDFLKAL